ncbi:MAG: ribosome small subunit-dependent GTPase A [Oscillospiraceae bacterium]|nr:ribosome small subunit-dependent GTPase A [Oscillospiraceae bacterium]
MEQGIIVKALSGFYYVQSGGECVVCRGRGKLRQDGVSPLVGDRVGFERAGDGSGTVKTIEPRRNYFVRPAVANIDLMVIVASAVNPVSDPFLLDRMTSLAEKHDCDVLICINKADMDPGDALYDTYTRAGFSVLRTSAVTGEGVAALAEALQGRTAAFSGNSGVGKSSLLNAMEPSLRLLTGEVSEKLGRGRHTTRHVQLFPLSGGGYLADTPGFGSFDLEQMESVRREDLQYCFREFAPYLGRCRFNDCAHLKEPDCAVLEALQRGEIVPSRHSSYARLYEQAAKLKDWELR